MRLNDLLFESVDEKILSKMGDINIEHESKMVLKQVKGQAAERVAAFIRVGEFLIQERDKQGFGAPRAGEPKYYLEAKKKLGLSNIQAKRYTRIASDKRIQNLTMQDIKKLGHYSFHTLVKMAAMDDKEFREFIDKGGKEEGVFHKSFTGSPSTILNKVEEFLDTIDDKKVTIQVTNKKSVS